MKIVIAGAGEVGSHLAKMLSNESNEITVIDSNPARLDALTANTDVITVDKNPFTEPTRTIRLGSRGEGAKWTQWYLWRFGLIDQSGIDGDIGPISDAAIREAQRRLGLKDDGAVGPVTKSVFKKIC